MKQKLLTSLLEHHRGIPNIIGLILVTVIFLVPFTQVTPAQALPAGFQEYYVLGNEEHVYNMFSHIDGIEFTSYDIIASNQMRSVVTVVATADNQTFYYDHWEDGYEADIFNPIQSSTQIYGDGNLSNGGSGTDILTAGTIVSLKSDGSGSGINSTVSVNSRGTDIRFDGGDYLVSTGGPVDLAHAMWPQDGTWIGGAWEIYSLQAWDKSFSYQVPVGVDSGFGDFKYAWLEIGALYDNTTVSIDNGTDTVVISLNKGQTYSSMGSIDSQPSSAITINEGTAISADKQIQVGLVTGGAGTFQTRFYVMIPDIIWSTEYVAAVPRSTSGQEAELYLYNPNNYTITVQAYDTSGNDTLTIAAGDVIAYSSQAGHVPIGSAARLESDDVFWGLVAADTLSTSYDWGFGLIPTTYLTNDYFTSWAPGNFLDPVSSGANASPVWITPLADGTTVFVDYGPTDGVVDETFTMNSLETRRIFDPDSDNSGMHIWATDKFIPIWGVDPASNEAVNGFDLGYTILPLYQGWLDPVLTMDKTSDTEILPIEGGTATFTLDVNTYSPAPVTSISITDTLPLSWTYKTGTAIVTYPDDSTAAVEPAQNGQNLAWNLSQTLDANQNLRLQFEAQIQTGGTIGTTRSDDFENGEVYNGGTTNWAGDWIETDSGGGGAGGGRVSVSNTDPYAGSYHLYLQNDNSIERSVDLTGFASPVLRFKKKHQVNDNNEHWYLDVHNGVSYTRVLTWSNNLEEGSYYQEEVNLSPYITDTTKIRFSTSSNLENDDYLYVDNVEIYDAIVVSENHAVATGTYRNHIFNAADSATVRISALDLAKTVDRATAFINDTLVYSLTYQNNGAITTTNTVINDLVPLNTTFVNASTGGTYNSATNTVRWNLGNVVPAATDVVTFSVTVDRETDNGTLIGNFGQIDSDQTELVNSNLVKTTVQAPDLNISLSGPSVAAPGNTITYTLTYANNGAADATGVIISNTTPASMTYVAGSLSINTGSGWVSLTDAADTDAGRYTGSVVSLLPGLISGTIAAGETGQIRFAVTINPAVTEGSSIGNKAQIDSAQSSPANSNLFSIDISPLSISKTSDVSITAAGQTVAFTGAYANNGSITLTNVTLVDSIPANTKLISGTVTGNNMSIEYSANHGVTWSSTFTNPTLVTDIRWNRTTLSAAETGTVGFQVKLANPLPANTAIQNIAKITSTQTAASGWLYSNPVSIGTIDLKISKIAHTTFVRAGDPITYTITYGNNGSVAATGVVISDIVPANTTYVPGSIFGSGADDSDPAELAWNLTVPANSGGYKVGFVTAVTDTVDPGTSIYNTASMANAYDSASSNQVQVTVAQDGVTISPNRSDDTHDQGQQICYGHTVGNTGNLTNTLELAATHNTWTSATVTFYRDHDADGNYDAGLDTTLTDTNSNTTVDTGELKPGQQIKILACFTIPTTGVNDGDTDTLTIQAATADGDTYTSQVTDTTTVRIENFLTITAPAANLVTNATSISYTGTTNPNATVVITNTTTGVEYTITADGFGNFAATITTTLGANTITTRSTDLDDDIATDTRTITRTPDTTDSDNDVTIIQPTAGTITSTTSVSVTGTTDPGSTITVTVGSAGPFITTADNSGNFSLRVTLPDVGSNTIAVTSTDPFGNVDTATRDVTLTTDTSDITNTLVITSPTEGQVITTSTISAIGQTDPGSTITITVSTGDVVTGTTSLTDGTFNIGGVDLITGTNVITIVSTDPYGNPITETVTVILTDDTTPSQNELTITAPVSGTITTTTSISVVGNTDPGSAITITTAAGTYSDTAANNGNFSTSVSLAYGWNTIVVTGTDVYGQVATDTIQVRLTNDTTPDDNDVAIIFPPVGYVTHTVTIPVTGTANADSVITATVGSAGPFTTTVDSNGVYTVTVSLPVTGTNTITVIATDIYGNQATATRDVTLTDDDTPAGSTVEITSPSTGYVTTATTTTVTGTGDPGATISIMVEGSGPFTATVGADGTFTVTVDLPTAGINTIEVTATDPYGNVDTKNRDVLRHPLINFSGGSYSANEGGTATITVTLSTVSNVTTTVAYATGNGTAQVGSDYTGASGVLTFTAGITSLTVNIPISSDSLDENNETFNISLSNPVSGTLGTVDSATVTILDGNDPPTVNFSTSSTSAGEGSGVYTITVNLNTASGLDVTIPFTVSGTAAEGAGNDFTIVSSPVTIPAGQTSAVITITLNEDTAAEGNETIVVEIGTPTHATTGATGSHTLTIVDDDFTLTRYTSGGGLIGPDPNQSTYTYGDVVSLTATANPGWSFQNWSGDATGATSPVTLTMTSNKAVTATFVQEQYTLETNVVGSGWVITSPAQSTYTYGKVVTLTAHALPGYTFTSWSGDLSGINESENLTMDGNKIVTATFTQNGYSLTINQVGNGAVISNPAQSTYQYGDTITLTANTDADPGWTFTDWSGGLTSNNNPYSFEIYQNTTVTATFTQDAYSLNLNSPENGTISVDPNNSTYSYGDVVTLTATADPGWSFTGWSGDVSGSNSQQSVTITGTMTITANFSQNEYMLAVTTAGTGSVEINPIQATYNYGDEVTLTATTTTPGWTFVGWSGDTTGTSITKTLTITGNTVVTATFSQNAYTLDVSVVGNGSVVSTPVKSTYNYGEVVILTATPDSAWNFTNWSGDATGTTTPVTVTMTSNRAVTATFTEDTSTTLNFSKTALDVNGESLLVTDTIRYTLQVTNTGGYTASNVVVTDTLPGSVDLVGITRSQGTSTGTEEIVWTVGELAPNGGTGTMVITVTLNATSLNQSIVNNASVSASNAAAQADTVCPDGQDPVNGVCDAKPQESAEPSSPGGVFLPIIMR